MHSPISRRYIGESVVLPDQLVGAVVLVGDGSRPLGDRGYVPVVVVGVFVRVVIAVLVGRDLYLETVNISSNGIVKRAVPLTPSIDTDQEYGRHHLSFVFCRKCQYPTLPFYHIH